MGNTEDQRFEIVFEYNIKEDSIYHPAKAATIHFGVPQRVKQVQDYFLRYGVILPESGKVFLNLFRAVCKGDAHAEGVVRARTAKGALIWVHIALSTVYNDKGSPVRALGVIRNATDLCEAELLRVDELFYQDIMMREALIYYEANLTSGKMTFGAEAFLKTIQAPLTEDYDAVMRLLTNMMVYPTDRAAVFAAFCTKTLLAGYTQGKWYTTIEYRRLTGEGSAVWVRGTAYLSKQVATQDVILHFYVSDINDQKLRKTDLRERTERDSLTGLYNRVTAELQMQEAIANDLASAQGGAVLLLFLNGFHQLTRRCGPYAGDSLISELGGIFAQKCKEEDIAGHYGGAEFLFYLRNINTYEEATRRAYALCETVKDILKEHNVTLEIGFALSPEHGTTLSSLRRKADIARAACNRAATAVHAYDPKLDLVAGKMLQLGGDGIDLTEESVIEHVFRALYESKNLKSTVQQVLELVTNAFGFYRGYVFDLEIDGTAVCTFDCYAMGIETVPEARRMLNKDQVAEVKKVFEKQEYYICYQEPNVSVVPLRLLYSFYDGTRLHGFIGFNRTTEKPLLSKNQIYSLQGIMRLLGLFLASRDVSRDLSESSSLLQSVMDALPSCTYIIDPTTHVMKYVNRATRKLMIKADPGRYCYEALRGRKAPCEDCPIDRMLLENRQSDQSEMFLGEYKVWARVNASLVALPNGQLLGVFNSFDFSEHKHETDGNTNLSDFTHDTSLYDALSVSTDDYILMCDMATKRFYFPKRMVEEFDLPGQVIVDAIPMWVERLHKDDRADFLADITAMFEGETTTHDQEYRVMNKNGEWVWLRAKGHVEHNSEGIPRLFAVVLTDLGRKSKVDQLTGLLDKYEFEVSTRAQLASGLESGALLLLGLDNFRYINNIYGWEVGDNVLKESTLRLLATLPEKTQLYRLDGDKFGVFFPKGDNSVAEAYYHSLVNVFRQHRQFGEHKYYCTVSAGCASFYGEIPTFGVLYKQAVCALDISKKDGKNRLTVYDAKTMSANERVLALMAALQNSVERNCEGFTVYYQPQLDPNTRAVNSAEALLRWKSDALGMVSPGEFIPLLEETGLIHSVGRWVLLQAAITCKKWRSSVPNFTVSVNISFAQLQEQSFLPYLAQQIEDRALDPAMLHLEITESRIVNGSLLLNESVQALRNMGFQIEMDDFGTGYSSLEVLKNAPADVVKIDQAFVRDITHSNFDATFIRIIVELCHSVNIRVCLEGVETQEEYEMVIPMHLDLIQGFLFGRPQPEEDFTKNYILAKE